MFYLSGEIPRVTPFERGLPAHYQKNADGNWMPDPLLMDERFLMVQVEGKGLIVFTACSHAGVVNVLKHARECAADTPIHAVMGGFHLSGANEEIIPETVAGPVGIEATHDRRRTLHRLASGQRACQRLRRRRDRPLGRRQTLYVLNKRPRGEARLTSIRSRNMPEETIAYRDPNALVQTDWLEAHRGDTNLRIFDCTTHLQPAEPGTDIPYRIVSGKADYDAGHIPGAGFLDIQGELSDNTTKLRFMLPSPDAVRRNHVAARRR